MKICESLRRCENEATHLLLYNTILRELLSYMFDLPVPIKTIVTLNHLLSIHPHPHAKDQTKKAHQ
jgi:hypothetical protein